MRLRQLVNEFRPVAVVLAILAGLYFIDLGIARAVVGFWGGALGIDADTSLRSISPALLDDGFCFAVLVLLAIIASWVPPLGDACSRLLARVNAVCINDHVGFPISLALLGLAAWHLAYHDTGTVRGTIALAVDGLKWLAVHTNPSPAPPPSHTHPICPYDLDPLVNAPCDAIALGVIMAGVASVYSTCLPLLWGQRKRTACPPLSPFQEL